jgi:hypothetical protein
MTAAIVRDPIGDGNKIDAQFGELGKALSDLREEITKSNAAECRISRNGPS